MHVHAYIITPIYVHQNLLNVRSRPSLLYIHHPPPNSTQEVTTFVPWRSSVSYERNSVRDIALRSLL